MVDLTAKDVCQELQISRFTLYRLIKEEGLESYQISERGHHRFTRKALDAFKLANRA